MSEILHKDKVVELKKEIKELSEKNERLRRAVDELPTLNELALDIGGMLTAKRLCERLSGLFGSCRRQDGKQ